MSDYSKLEQVRLQKIQNLKDRGIEPYPRRVERTHTNLEALHVFEEGEAQGAEEEIQATLVGRLRSIRTMGKITFAHIEDGSGRVQLFLRANDVGDDQLEFFNQNFDLGDFVLAKGVMFRTRAGEASLKVTDFSMIAKAITPLPASKDEIVDGEVVQHAVLSDPELRYRQRYADLAVNESIRDIFRTRTQIVRALQDFLDSHGFLEVETPILQPIYGGAAARPFTTHHNQLKQDLYLRISFELYLKRLLVGGFERVYEIGRDFRNEGVSFKHNPEFTQLEFYMAYADYKAVMQLTEQMIVSVADGVIGSRKIIYQGNEINLEIPWNRIELREAIAEFSGIDIADYMTADDLSRAMKSKGMEPAKEATRGKLIDSLLGEFVEPRLIQPTFLYDYPRDISPLAKTTPDDDQIVERFEGFIGGMEICNAFTELNDPVDQEARFIEMGRDYAADDEERHPLDEDYLRAMRYGMPPAGGFGMGVDRLTMLFTDCHSIREVILFPHLRSLEK